MSCQCCTKKFGLFNREAGCPNCNFSFCSKCIKYPIAIPKFSNEKKKVCPLCFAKLSEKQTELNNERQIIMNISKRTTVKKTEDCVNESLIDDDITEKLAALREQPTTSNPTNDDDISKRLANLRGVDFKDYTKSNQKLIHKVDKRTDEEKIRDLMEMYEEETNLTENYEQSRTDPVAEIEARLAKLRETDKTSDTTTQMVKPDIPIPLEEESEDEDEEAKKLTKKFLAEAELDIGIGAEEIEFDQSLIKGNPKDNEELPWCTICNEDAIFRCLDCDGELFCRGCFKECHYDDEDYRNHRTKPYKNPKPEIN